MLNSKKAIFDFEKAEKYTFDFAKNSSEKMKSNNIMVKICVGIELLFNLIFLILQAVFAINYFSLILTVVNVVLCSGYFALTFFVNYKAKYFNMKIFDYLYMFVTTILLIIYVVIIGFYSPYKSLYIFGFSIKILFLLVFILSIKFSSKRKFSIRNCILLSLGHLANIVLIFFFINTFFVKNINVFDGYRKLDYTILEDGTCEVDGVLPGIGDKVLIPEYIGSHKVVSVHTSVLNSTKKVFIESKEVLKIEKDLTSNIKSNIYVPEELIDTYRTNYYYLHDLYSAFRPNVSSDKKYYIFNELKDSIYSPNKIIPTIICDKDKLIKNYEDLLTEFDLGFLENYIRYRAVSTDNIQRKNELLEYSYYYLNKYNLLIDSFDNNRYVSKVYTFSFENIYKINFVNDVKSTIEKWDTSHYVTNSVFDEELFESPKDGWDVSYQIGTSGINSKKQFFEYIKNKNVNDITLTPVITISDIPNLKILYNKSKYYYGDVIYINYSSDHPLKEIYTLYDKNNNVLIDGSSNILTYDFGNLKVSDSGIYRLEVFVYDEIDTDLCKTFNKEIEIIINKKIISPSITNSSVEYDGNAHSLGIPSSPLYNIGDNSFINAGSYNVYVELVDKANYCFSNNSDKTTFPFTISKKVVNTPQKDNNIYYYTGSEITYNLEESEYYNILGNKKINAGSYDVIISLIDKDNYCFSNNSSIDLNYTFVINKARIKEPNISKLVYTYTGESITFEIPESEFYTISKKSAIEVGEYEITININDTDNYCFETNNSSSLLYTFTIKEAS